MIALIRYTTASMLHSQRYLAPALLFMAVVGISSSNDSGPLPPVYGLCAGALCVCATWLTIVVIGIEDPAHRAILIVSSGDSRRVLAASVSVAVISCSVLSVIGLMLPLLVGTHTVGISDLVLGFEAESTCAAVGISIGLLCSRLVIRRQGYALILAIGLVMAVLLVRGLPPINVLIRLMVNGTASGVLISPAGGLLAIAFVVLVSSSIATQFVATRKD